MLEQLPPKGGSRASELQFHRPPQPRPTPRLPQAPGGAPGARATRSTRVLAPCVGGLAPSWGEGAGHRGAFSSVSATAPGFRPPPSGPPGEAPRRLPPAPAHPVPRTPSPRPGRRSQEPAGPTAPPRPHDLPPAAAAQGNRKGRAALGGSAGSGAGLSGAAAGPLAARPAQAGQGRGERQAGADPGVPCPCQPQAPPSHWAMEASPRVRLRLSTRRRDAQRAESSAAGGAQGPGSDPGTPSHSTQGLTPRFPPQDCSPGRAGSLGSGGDWRAEGCLFLC